MKKILIAFSVLSMFGLNASDDVVQRFIENREKLPGDKRIVTDAHVITMTMLPKPSIISDYTNINPKVLKNKTAVLANKLEDYASGKDVMSDEVASAMYYGIMVGMRIGIEVGKASIMASTNWWTKDQGNGEVFTKNSFDLFKELNKNLDTFPTSQEINKIEE